MENFKEQTAKEREKAEEKNLNYQNFSYQKENIISQINFCSNYPSEHLDKIKFSEKERVLEYYRSKGVDRSDANLETMDCLKYELEMRKTLDDTLKNLVKEKDLNEDKLKQKEIFFRELPSYMKDLEISTLKAQNYLNLNISSHNSNSILSEKLPQPLFVLYNSINCIDKSKLVYELEILGREEEVSEFYERYPIDNINLNNIHENSDKKAVTNAKKRSHGADNKEEGEHTDSGEINESEIDLNDVKDTKENNKKEKSKEIFLRRKRNITKDKNKIDISQDKIFFQTLSESNDEIDVINLPKIKKFPLYLHLEIKKLNPSPHLADESLFSNVNRSILPLCLNFYFIPIFNIVTVEVTSNNKNSSFYVNTNHIMSNLFSPPANLLSTLKSEINKAVCFLCDECSSNERFYDYIQILANNINYNLAYLKKISDIVKNKNKTNFVNSFESKQAYFDSPSKINVDNFIDLLTQRIIYLPILLSQVDFLIKNKKIFPDAVNEIKSEKRFNLVKERTIITDVARISQNEFLQIFQEKYDHDFSEENFKMISIFDKDQEGKYYKKFLKVPITFFSEEEAIYLIIKFERKSAKMIAYVEIGLDYPNRYNINYYKIFN